MENNMTSDKLKKRRARRRVFAFLLLILIFGLYPLIVHLTVNYALSSQCENGALKEYGEEYCHCVETKFDNELTYKNLFLFPYLVVKDDGFICRTIAHPECAVIFQSTLDSMYEGEEYQQRLDMVTEVLPACFAESLKNER